MKGAAWILLAWMLSILAGDLVADEQQGHSVSWLEYFSAREREPAAREPQQDAGIPARRATRYGMGYEQRMRMGQPGAGSPRGRGPGAGSGRGRGRGRH